MRNCRLRHLFFFLLASLTVSCEYDEGATDISFVKFFGEGFNDYGIDMCLLDNTIVVLSNITKDNKVSPCLYFFNQYGEKDGESRIFNDQAVDEYGKKLLIDNSKNLYLISNKLDEQENSRVFVRRIQIDGDISWENTYGESNTSSSDALISDNTIIVIGKTWEAEDDIDALFLKIGQEDGDLIEQKFYIGNKGNDEAVKIIEFDEEYVFVGYTESYPPTIEGKNIWLVKLNSKGENIAPYSFGSKRINEGLVLKKIGNSVIISSVERRTETGIKELNLYSIGYDDNNININWHTELIDNKNVVPIDILVKDNNFVLPSNRYGISNNGNISLYYYDLDGNHLFHKEFGAADETILRVNSSMYLDDGSLLLLGYNESKGHSDVALIKVKVNNDFDK